MPVWTLLTVLILTVIGTYVAVSARSRLSRRLVPSVIALGIITIAVVAYGWVAVAPFTEVIVLTLGLAGLLAVFFLARSGQLALAVLLGIVFLAYGMLYVGERQAWVVADTGRLYVYAAIIAAFLCLIWLQRRPRNSSS